MEIAKLSTQISKAAPTLPVLLVILDGVEKIPEPMIRPTLSDY